MRLTTHSDLCFKTLIYLGLGGEHGSTVAEIAAAISASENHLRKVVLELARLKLVKATRGRNGGVTLNIVPSAVTIGNLMRMFEPDFAAAECLGAAQHGCVIFGSCGLQGVFNESLKALFEVLNRHTLQDVLLSSRGAAANLQIDRSAAIARRESQT